MEKSFHFFRESHGFRGLEMNLLMADRAGDNLHRPTAVVPPRSCYNFVEPAQPARKKTRMPSEETVFRKRLVIILTRIKHHFHHTVNMPVGRNKAGNFQTKPSCNGRPDLAGIQNLSFNLARLDNVEGEGLKQCLAS